MTRAQADASDVGAGIRTRNEIRAERGIPLMDEAEADQLGVSSANGVIFLAGTLKQQQAQQAQAEQPSGAPGGPEQPTKQGGDASNPDEPAGPESTGGGSSAEGDRDSEAASSKPSEPESASERRPTVTAKDDVRQPDATPVSNTTKKELDAFGRFAKARLASNRWRDFDFTHLDERIAQDLNAAGRNGDAEALRYAIAKAGNAAALIEWYNDGADGQIEWGEPGDFDACVAIAGAHIDDAEGFCNLRHQDAVGGAPGSEDKAQKAAGDTFTPPKAVQEEAQRALDWIADGHAGPNFTDVGRKRASDLAAGHGVSLDTVKRIASFLARHEVDNQGKGWSPSEDGYPSPGRVAWAAWGGKPAVGWANSILSATEKAAGDVAFVSPSGQIVMPEPLKAGDKIIVQHADKTDDTYPIVNASEPTATTADDEDGKSAARQVDEIEDAEKALGNSIGDYFEDIDEVDDAADIIVKALAPELERLRQSYEMLNQVRSQTQE